MHLVGRWYINIQLTPNCVCERRDRDDMTLIHIRVSLSLSRDAVVVVVVAALL